MHNLAVRVLLNGVEGAVETSNGLDNVLNNVLKVVDFSGTMLDVMLAHPIYSFLFAVSFVGIGIGIINMFRSGARG